MYSTFASLLLLLVALVTLSTVEAFAPLKVSQQQQQQQPQRPVRNTRLYESILEAEDRYLEQAANAMGVLEKERGKKKIPSFDAAAGETSDEDGMKRIFAS